MLQTIRNVVTGWFAVVIVALLIIPFAFWGINYYFDPAPDRTVAKVNDREISVAEFQRAYFNYRQQLSEFLGSIDLSDEEPIKRETLEMLIETEVLGQLARKSGMRLGDDDVVRLIAGLEAFQYGGRFDPELYNQALRRLGMTPASFEEQLRAEMLQEQFQAAILDTAFVTSREINDLARIQSETRDIVYSIIDSRPIYDEIEVSDEDIAAYYEANQDYYMEPEQIRIEYLEMTVDALADELVFSDDELLAYYENNKLRYEDEETRRTTQLYIKLDEDADEDQVAQAEQHMAFMMERIDAGDSLEEIATEYSAQFGPDFDLLTLGYLAPGVMAPAVDEVVFDMEEEEIRGPLRSEVGKHIIRLDDIRPPVENIFENMRDQVEQDYALEQAEQLFLERIDDLATLSFEHPDTLEVAAEAVGLPIKTSDWFDRGGGSGIAAHGDVVMTSFSEEVLETGHNSDVIELDLDHMVVLRIIDRQPEQQIPLDEVRDEIVDDLRFERAQAEARRIGEEILAALRNGDDYDHLARQFGVEWHYAEDVTRDDFEVNRTVLRTAFRAGKPEAGAPIHTGVSIGSGDYIIVGVEAVHEPSEDTLTADERQALESRLARARAESNWQLLVEEARRAADVRIYEDNL